MHVRRAPFLLLACAGLVGVASAQIRVTPLLELEGETDEPSLSPDGKMLVFGWCKPEPTYSCGIYTRPLTGGDVRLFAGWDIKEGLPAYPKWSPDGKKIAFTRFLSHFDNHLFVRNSNGGTERDFGLICDRAPVSNWSPDGRFLVASVYTEDTPRKFDCRPALFSAETGKRIRQMAPHGGASSFSPDGRMLAYADGKGLMLLRLTVDYRPMSPPVTLAREPSEISGVSWTPDGKQIIYRAWGDVPYLRRLRLTPGAKPQAIPGLPGELSITQLLADGSALATETTQVEALWRADLHSTPPNVQIVTDPGCSARAPGCSPDGKLRAFITTRRGISEIWLANADGINERPLVRSIPAFTDPKDDGVPSLGGWSPDGKWISFTVFPRSGNADLRSHLYVVPSSGGTPRRLGNEAYALDNPTWSGGGKALYASQGWSSRDEIHGVEWPIVRVDIADGKMIPIGADGMWPQTSPDGKFLYFFTNPRHKLYRVPIGGGVEERLLDQDDLLWFNDAVGARYLYLFQSTSSLACKMIRFDPESKESNTLAEISFRPRFAYLSRDERFLYFGQQEDPKRRVVLVHGLF
jgi:Tol biopolymer transport system component